MLTFDRNWVPTQSRHRAILILGYLFLERLCGILILIRIYLKLWV
jgi:hypothetical protein